MVNIKAKSPVEEKSPWNLIGYIPLGGPCGMGQVFRHYKRGLQVISSVDLDRTKTGFEWHLSVRTFPELGPPDEASLEMVRVGFGLEGFIEDHTPKAAHFYLPVARAEVA